MRPPWSGQGQESAELEALQTDVMRFIAILGLCLAAIFSLVHSAARERQPIEKVINEPQLVERVPEPAAASPPVVVESQIARPTGSAPARPALPDPEQEQGFTLEFASGEVLQSLLVAGQVRLYARVGAGFWGADKRGHFVPVQPPGEYYQMTVATVPPRLRRSLALVTEEGATWGVALPPGMVRQIEELVGSREGGSLLISGKGQVLLEDR